MKQKTLLFSALAIFTAIVFSSNKNGPVAAGTGNRTGSNGTAANCSGSGCHASNTTNTNFNLLTILDSPTVTQVTSYIPGKTYYINFGAQSSNTNLKNYGFQLSVVQASNTSMQAGSLDSLPLNNQPHGIVRTSGSLQILEHYKPASAPLTSGKRQALIGGMWHAPASSVGPVKFFCTVNMTDSSNTSLGDEPNNVTYTLNPSSVSDLENHVSISTYPNPFNNYLEIRMENAEAGNYTINAYDLHGRKICAQELKLTTATYKASINTAEWPKGIYLVQVVKDGMQKTIQVVK
jgi:hypothetical protein